MTGNEIDTTTGTATEGTMPATSREARDQLDVLGSFTTASEWKRSAIVYALAFPMPGRRSDMTPSGALQNARKLDFKSLADWGSRGLTTRQSVGSYWHRWDDAVKAGYAEPTVMGGPYVPPHKPDGELVEWPGYLDYKTPSGKSPALLPAVIPVRVVAAEPGTPRWRELVRMGISPLTEWEPGDAATEVFPPSYVDVVGLNAQCARNMEIYSHDTGRSLDVLGARWEVSVRWPYGTRVEDCTWSAHRELRRNPQLLRPGMTRVEASMAAHKARGRLIRAAIEDLSEGFEVEWNEDRPMTGERDLPYLVYELDVLRGWAGRHQALAEGGKEGYFQYIADHPFPFDLWSAEYGDPAPATDKYQRERQAAHEFRLAWESSGKKWRE